jgi:hypothetical protein
MRASPFAFLLAITLKRKKAFPQKGFAALRKT